MTNELNDSLDDLLGIINAPKRTADLPQDPQLARVRETVFTENCPKCNGSGRFTSWSGRQMGECFACKGRGSRSFRSSPDQRGRAQEARAALPGRRWEAFMEDHAAQAAWILRKAPTFAFAASMKGAVEKYGNLTDGQMTAVGNCMNRELPPKRAEESTRVDVSKIIAAIHAGKTAGLIWITLRFDGIVIKEAKKFPGVLYVLHSSKEDQTGKKLYLGKIDDGLFHPSRSCTPEDRAKIILIASDPLAAAKVYGNVTNSCCVCGRGLTNKQSVEEGIGPICSNRVGWTKGGLRVQAIVEAL